MSFMQHSRLGRLVIVASLAAVPAGMSLSVLAPVARAANDEKPKKKHEGKETELEKQMEVIDKGMKALRKLLKKPEENAASLKTIGDIKQAAAASKEQIPAMTATLPEGERKKFAEDYKKDMDAFIAEVDKLEAAVKANKNEDAVEIHKKLKEMEEAGHDKFTK